MQLTESRLLQLAKAWQMPPDLVRGLRSLDQPEQVALLQFLAKRRELLQERLESREGAELFRAQGAVNELRATENVLKSVIEELEDYGNES